MKTIPIFFGLLSIGLLSAPCHAEPTEAQKKLLAEAEALHTKMVALYRKGKYTEAIALSKKALEIKKGVLGEKYPDYATDLNGLAFLYDSMGDYAKAEPLYRNALEIHRAVLGEKHPDYATSLNNLAGLLAARGQPAQALPLMQEAWRIHDAQRAAIFGFTSEREQLAFAQTLKGHIDTNLSLAAEHLAQDPQARRFASSVVLSIKGAILETLMRRQEMLLKGSDPQPQALWRDYQSASEQLLKAVMAGPMPGRGAAGHQATIAELEAEKRRAEETLARASSAFAAEQRVGRTTLSDLAKALPANACLVEFARYQSFNFGVKGNEKKWGEWKYVALVLRGFPDSEKSGHDGDHSADVQLIPLGPAEPIEKAVQEWRKLAGPDLSQRTATPHQRELLDPAAEELSKRVWQPLAPAIGDARRLYLCPDGELSFVAFEALPMPARQTGQAGPLGRAPGQFLIEEYELVYVATGRDLTRPAGIAGRQAGVDREGAGRGPLSAPVLLGRVRRQRDRPGAG
ncbi:MAG: tetratricopeptide repeat protein [Planctomycetes bacterium]|nr:tetratricopeptide repeat protein [Planctomycetota bacterium]